MYENVARIVSIISGIFIPHSLKLFLLGVTYELYLNLKLPICNLIVVARMTIAKNRHWKIISHYTNC